jgi:protein involved in sex pheromone biosynthesis
MLPLIYQTQTTMIDFTQFTNDQLDVIYEKTVGYRPIADDGLTREDAIELIASYDREHGVTIPSQIENSAEGIKAMK